MSGVRTTIEASGSSPVSRHSDQVMNAARIRNAPWAMLITFITPKISVRPDASSAYTPPIRSPSIRAWRNSVTGRLQPGGGLLSAARRVPAGEDLVSRGRLLGQNDLRHAALPLAHEELALRAAGVVPGQRSEDGVDLVLAQPVGQLDLALALDRADRVHRRLEHLRRGVGVGCVLRRLLADRLGVLIAERRGRGLVEDLRREVCLPERAHHAHAVLERRAVHDHVRVPRLQRVRDAVEVRVVDRVRLAVDGLDPGRLEDRLDPLGGRLVEGIVERRVGRRLRALPLGKLCDVVGPELALLVGRRLLREEQVPETAVEQLGRAARGLDVEHPVAFRHRGRREVEERGERAEQEVHLVLADQRVVVRDDRVLVALVVLDDHLDRAPVDQPTALVDHRLPDLVALARGLAGLREFAGQGERGADLDRVATRLSASASAAVIVVTATGRDEQSCGQQRENEPTKLPHLTSPSASPDGVLQTFAAIVCTLAPPRETCQEGRPRRARKGRETREPRRSRGSLSTKVYAPVPYPPAYSSAAASTSARSQSLISSINSSFRASCTSIVSPSSRTPARTSTSCPVSQTSGRRSPIRSGSSGSMREIARSSAASPLASLRHSAGTFSREICSTTSRLNWPTYWPLVQARRKPTIASRFSSSVPGSTASGLPSIRPTFSGVMLRSATSFALSAVKSEALPT